MGAPKPPLTPKDIQDIHSRIAGDEYLSNIARDYGLTGKEISKFICPPKLEPTSTKLTYLEVVKLIEQDECPHAANLCLACRRALLEWVRGKREDWE